MAGWKAGPGALWRVRFLFCAAAVTPATLGAGAGVAEAAGWPVSVGGKVSWPEAQAASMVLDGQRVDVRRIGGRLLGDGGARAPIRIVGDKQGGEAEWDAKGQVAAVLRAAAAQLAVLLDRRTGRVQRAGQGHPSPGGRVPVRLLAN